MASAVSSGRDTVFLDGFAFAMLRGLLLPGLSLKRTRNERDRAEKNPYPKRNDTSHDLTARFSVTDDRKKKSLAKSRVPLRRFQHPEITLRQWRKSVNLSSRELAVYHLRHELAKYWLITVAAATHWRLERGKGDESLPCNAAHCTVSSAMENRAKGSYHSDPPLAHHTIVLPIQFGVDLAAALYTLVTLP